MQLKQLATKPQLLEIKIEDESTVVKYGEAISFWVYDRQSIETFAKLATLKAEDFSSAAALVKDLILDEEGKPIVNSGLELPTDIMMKAVTKVIEELGKLVATSLPPTTKTFNS